MQMPPKLPKSLEFLDRFYEPPSSAYKKSSWLLNDFDSVKWSYTFDFVKPSEIDWDVQLEDGISLTHPKHKNLLNSFKYFLLASTHSHLGIETDANAVVSQYRTFNAAAKVIDYLLLNSEGFELAKYGLGALTSSDLTSMLNQIASSSDTTVSVYSWPEKMSRFCEQLTNSTPPEDILRALDEVPGLSVVDDEYPEELGITLPMEKLPAARAALYIHNFYVSNSKWGYTPNSLRLSEILLRNTITGRNTIKPVLPQLAYKSQSTSFIREMPAVKVTMTEHEKMKDSKVRIFKKVIYNLGTLHELNLAAPTVKDLTKFLGSEIETSEPGRFRTVPAEVVFGVFCSAVEFHIDHGQKIINAFCTVVEYCQKNEITLQSVPDSKFMTLVGSEITDFGVRKLGLSCRSRNGLSYPTARVIKHDIQQYYKHLRANVGLLEAVSIYIGVVQLVVGALMARRQGELVDLHADDCLDHTQRWLIFKNRKSSRNLFGLRKLEARPIEPVAVQMINNLIAMQRRLLAVGYIDEMMGLFSAPSLNGHDGMTQSNIYRFNRNLDLVCDYFQTECNSLGERYYIRQHQLRRFFAMLFFHSCSFGGIDTLRWMLGHTDMMHIYHYITETVDGAVLRGAKAQYLAEQIHQEGIDAFEDLGALLKARYGTEDFILSDADELEEEIDSLMQAGEVTVEPEFFVDQHSHHMKMLVKVTAKCA